MPGRVSSMMYLSLRDHLVGRAGDDEHAVELVLERRVAARADRPAGRELDEAAPLRRARNSRKGLTTRDAQAR